MKATDLSRQQRRKRKRDLSRQVGKLKAVHNEITTGALKGPRRKLAFKQFFRLQHELMVAGVIKRPGFFKTALGRLKATARLIWR